MAKELGLLSNRIAEQYKPRLLIIRLMLGQHGYKILLLVVWLIVLGLFLWLPRVNLLAYIFTQAPIGLSDKLKFITDDFNRIATSINNPIVISTLIFSILTALSIVLLIFMVRTAKLLRTRGHSQAKAQVGVAATVFGSHLMSCGGTILLAPIFPALAGTGTVLGGQGVIINMWLGTAANLLGIALIIYAINRTTEETAQMILKSPT